MRWLVALIASLSIAGCAGHTLAAPQVQAGTSADRPFATLSGIQRGQSVQVPLTLNNPHRQAIRIVEVTMRVADVNVGRCPDNALALRTYPKPIIGPEATGVILLTVQMSAQAPEVCDNTRWKVEFASRAETAS